MMSWLLPGALVMGAVLLLFTLRNRRTDRERAALLLWGGSLVVIGLTISLAQGIIHPYYTVAMAPPLGALVGIATMGLWERRDRWTARLGLAAALAVTVWWSYELLGRTSDWFPALRPFVAVAGALGVVAILVLPLLRSVPKLAVALVSVLGLGAALAAPLFSTVATAATPHQGAIPSVTPTPSAASAVPEGPAVASPAAASAELSAAASPAVAPPADRSLGAAGPATAASRSVAFRDGTGGRTGTGAGTGTGGGTASPFGGGFRRAFGGAGGRSGRVLERELLQSGPDAAAQDRRQPVHLGGGDGELQLRCGLPAGERRARDGDRRLQRDGPGADAGPVRALRGRGQDPLLHRRRRRWLRRGSETEAATTPRRSPRGSSRTSPPKTVGGVTVYDLTSARTPANAAG